MFAGDLFFWHLAILGTTVANATFLATTAPLLVALGAWLLLGEHRQRRASPGSRSASSAAPRCSATAMASRRSG